VINVSVATEEHGRSTCRDQNEGQGQTGIEREIAAITEPASGMFCDPNLWEEKALSYSVTLPVTEGDRTADQKKGDTRNGAGHRAVSGRPRISEKDEKRKHARGCASGSGTGSKIKQNRVNKQRGEEGSIRSSTS